MQQKQRGCGQAGVVAALHVSACRLQDAELSPLLALQAGQHCAGQHHKYESAANSGQALLLQDGTPGERLASPSRCLLWQPLQEASSSA